MVFHSLTLEMPPRSPLNRNSTRKSKRHARYSTSDEILQQTDTTRWFNSPGPVEIPHEVIVCAILVHACVRFYFCCMSYLDVSSNIGGDQ